MSIITGQQGGDAGQAQGSGAAGGAGNQAPTDWRSALPEDIRSEKVFESIKGKDLNEAFPVLAKNYLHAQKLVGADKLVIPGPTATPEEKAAFYTKLGRPEKPEEYGYKLPEGLTEDRLDKARIDAWRKEFHDAGIPKASAERFLNKFLADEFGTVQSREQAKAKELETNELAIKQEFGVKFDEKVNFARLALREFGNDGLSGLLEQTGLGSHPEVVKFFAKIGEGLADHRAVSGQGSQGNSFGSPAMAQQALTEFNANAENTKALLDRNHPRHDEVVSHRQKLFEAAFPKEVKE
jgi:hypothetical protein